MQQDQAFAGFQRRRVSTSAGALFVRLCGEGPPLLLLHGFPQTGVMWNAIAARLANRFTIIAPDLPGYGASDCPPDLPGHQHMSKRAMAAILLEAMQALGHRRFALAGHDRGARVAYRMALDHPGAVTRLAVLDAVPTLDVWNHIDATQMLSFWPFTLLAQNEPLPERLILAAPDAVVDNALQHWGSDPACFSPAARAEYVATLSDPDRVHAICEEYRAAATIDRVIDAEGRAAGATIQCPTLVLWSSKGGLSTWYEAQGGPLGIWRRWAAQVEGEGLDAGHFFSEERPDETASRFQRFFL